MLNNMVCVEGIVTRISGVKPKMAKSVHYCEKTKKYQEVQYSDWTCTNFDEKNRQNMAMPTTDIEGNQLVTEYGLCKFRDTQTFTIQEMPEKAPTGQIPRSIDIIADDDLVDSIKPGDRCIVVGAYRTLPHKKMGVTNGIFRTCVIANNVQSIADRGANNTYDRGEVEMIKEFARDRGQKPFETLARSIAPSIHGFDFIKKAVVCLLVGGTEKILANGSRLRGDINMMMIGDPSTAKSQMLRYVLATHPNAIATTGRGTTGVGLTAAVTTDPDSDERRLEAGAMVLADRGVVCIDEFDKMSDMDRTAIHEVMEQGRVTISKAGIHAKLNARCSVLAAANPVYGRYDPYKSPMDNIAMQDSLLSRFDLLFIVLDQPDIEKDKRISEHVLRMHRYRDPKEEDGTPLMIESGADRLTTEDLDANDDDEDEPMQVYEQHNPSLHGPQINRKQKICTKLFMKKYIAVAKMIQPKIKTEAAALLAEEYARLRSHECMEDGQGGGNGNARTTPVTARTLETLIRLATAHAKIRLAKTVVKKDAKVAIELVQYAYFQKVFEKPKRGGGKRKNAEEEQNNEDSDMSDEEDETIPESKRRKNQDAFDFTSTADNNTIVLSPKPQDENEPAEVEKIAIDDSRLENFQNQLSVIFDSERAQQMTTDIIVKGMEPHGFDNGEVLWALDKMMEDNKVFIADDIVFLV
jgi:DNA replication licensing factor MCM3